MKVIENFTFTNTIEWITGELYEKVDITDSHFFDVKYTYECTTYDKVVKVSTSLLNDNAKVYAIVKSGEECMLTVITLMELIDLAFNPNSKFDVRSHPNITGRVGFFTFINDKYIKYNIITDTFFKDVGVLIDSGDDISFNSTLDPDEDNNVLGIVYDFDFDSQSDYLQLVKVNKDNINY
jgi:hypothetical protein